MLCVNDDQVARKSFSRRVSRMKSLFYKAYCSRKCLPAKQRLMNSNIPSMIQETINQSQMAKSSATMPVATESDRKSVHQLTIDVQNNNSIFDFLDQRQFNQNSAYQVIDQLVSIDREGISL